jgi:hypothetical protein
MSRIVLFGLEKWHNVDRTAAHFAAALDRFGDFRSSRGESNDCECVSGVEVTNYALGELNAMPRN